MKNRLAVFFYDKNGVVRNYIYRYLAGLKKISSKIIFVSNGKIITTSKYNLLKIVDKIIERENFGFDAWAYKEAIEQYTWKKVYTFDEYGDRIPSD